MFKAFFCPQVVALQSVLLQVQKVVARAWLLWVGGLFSPIILEGYGTRAECHMNAS